MKFLKKAICVLLAATVVGAATACKKKAPPPVDPLTADAVLADFETWEDGFQLARIVNGFGKVSVNTDPAYVKSGQRSARLDPLGWAGAQSIPLVYFPTKSSELNFDHSNFLYVDYVQFEMYNACDEAKTCNVGLVGKEKGIDGIDRVNDVSLTLQPGWNTCYLNVDASLVAIGADITDIRGIYFMFENAHSMNVTGETPKYYLDNMQLIKKAEQNAQTFEFVLDTYEICDFEKAYQKYVVATEYPVDLSVVRASDYGLTAPSGKNVLRAVFHGTDTGYWRNVRISESLVQASYLGRVTEKEADDVYICFEVYNNYEAMPNINMPLDYTLGGKGKSFLSTACMTTYGQWVSYEYKLSDILNKESGFLENPGQLLISFKDVAGEREFFYDNFRVEVRN